MISLKLLFDKICNNIKLIQSSISSLQSSIDSLQNKINTINFRVGYTSNGAWMKIGPFGICWAEINFYVASKSEGTTTYTYPITFLYNPIVEVTPLYSNRPEYTQANAFNSDRKTAATIKAYNNSASGLQLYYSVLCIGIL